MTADATERTKNPVLRRWPALAGLVFAVFVAYGATTGSDLAPVLTASGFVYLGAAALRRRGAAWPMFLVSFVIIAAANFLPTDGVAVYTMIGVALLLAAYGLVRGAIRPPEGLPLQGLAMAVVGAASVAVLLVGGDFGAYLVAAGLLGHAVWDWHHHRTGRVVVRSMAEFCMVLDTVAAVVLVVVTAAN